MSSAVVSGGAKPYFCHVCSEIITVTDESEPFCLQGFVEECTDRNPNPSSSFRFNPDPSSDPPFPIHSSILPLLLSSASTPYIDFQSPNFFSTSPGPRTRPDIFDPFLFLQNHLRGLRYDGANVQFEINHTSEPSFRLQFEINHPSEPGFRFQFEINHPFEPGFRLPTNIGDSFLGPGHEQWTMQLVENDPNRYGTPPASKNAIENLPTVTVDDELLKSELKQCAVCQDEFETGSQVKQMPCKHVYHDGCLIPWLQLHNSCPVCRLELPTDDHDPDYVYLPTDDLDYVNWPGEGEGEGEGRRIIRFPDGSTTINFPLR